MMNIFNKEFLKRQKDTQLTQFTTTAFPFKAAMTTRHNSKKIFLTTYYPLSDHSFLYCLEWPSKNRALKASWKITTINNTTEWDATCNLYKN